jgi:hypothetical protein
MTHIQVFRLEKGRMGNDGHVNDIFERKIKHNAGYSGLNIAGRSSLR